MHGEISQALPANRTQFLFNVKCIVLISHFCYLIQLSTHIFITEAVEQSSKESLERSKKTCTEGPESEINKSSLKHFTQFLQNIVVS